MRFVIPKGEEFYCEFTIKEPGASIPMDLTGAAGTFKISTIGPNPCLILSDVPIVVVDPLNGLISITLTSEQTTLLDGRAGFAEDGYPIVPTYKGALDIIAQTQEVVDGPVIDVPVYVEIPQIYISNFGESCEL